MQTWVDHQMREITAGLSAIFTYGAVIVLMIVIEAPAREFLGWPAPESADMGLWRAGCGLVVAVCTYWIVVWLHTNAASRRRRTLMERARA